MAWRYYIAPADDPNGNAGKVIWTDDQGHFQVGGNNPETGQGPSTSNGTPQQATTPSVSAGAGAGGVAGAVGGLVDPSAIKALMDLASQNAQQAYLNARLELEKQNAGHEWTYQQEQLAQAAAHDAWQQAIAGREADISQAAATGYLGGVTNVASKVNAAWNALPPDQRTPDRATAIWKAYVPGMSDQQAQAMSQWGTDVFRATGQQVTDEMVGQQLASMGLGQGTPTLARQQMQNQTGLGLLGLAAGMRGPDDAFAYARTLQNVPPEMRQQLDAMMRSQGISYGGPGLGTVAGQLVQGGLGGQVQQGMAGMTQQAGNAMVASPTVGAAGMTQQIQPAMVAAPTNPLYSGQAIPSGPPPAGVSSSGGTYTTDIGHPAQSLAGQTQTGGNYLTYQGPNGQPTGGTPSTDLRTTSGAQQIQPYSMQSPSTGAATGGGVQHLYQMSAQQLNNTPDYVKRLMLSGLEAQGQDKSAELDMYQRSLPKYAGPQRATVRV